MDSPLFPVLMAFAPFFIVLFFWFMRCQRNCPECGEPLPLLLSPFQKTRRQWIEGGYVCAKCGSELDTAGNTVPANAPIRYKTFFTAIAILMPLSVLGIVLGALLLHR